MVGCCGEQDMASQCSTQPNVYDIHVSWCKIYWNYITKQFIYFSCTDYTLDSNIGVRDMILSDKLRLVNHKPLGNTFLTRLHNICGMNLKPSTPHQTTMTYIEIGTNNINTEKHVVESYFQKEGGCFSISITSIQVLRYLSRVNKRAMQIFHRARSANSPMT